MGIRRRLIAALPACLFLAACNPTLNWREVRPEGSGALLLLPCKPSTQQRRVHLAGIEVPLSLTACSAGDATWAIAFADVGDRARIGPALDELGRSAVSNLGAASAERRPLTVQDATPRPDSARLIIQGHLPDGQPVQEQLALFSKGTRVFQATAVGARLPADGLETFFGGLRTPE